MDTLSANNHECPVLWVLPAGTLRTVCPSPGVCVQLWVQVAGSDHEGLRLSSCLEDWLCAVFGVILEPLRKLPRKSMVKTTGAESPSVWLIHLFAPTGKIRAQWTGQSTDLMRLDGKPGKIAKVLRGTPHPRILLVYHDSVLLDGKWNIENSRRGG